jgi:DnaK suppressor protein
VSAKAPKKPPVKKPAARRADEAPAKKAAPPAPSRRPDPGVRPAGSKGAPPRGSGRVAVPEPPVKKRKSPFSKAELARFRVQLRSLLDNRRSDKESREREALKSTGQDFSVDHMADYGSDNYEQEFTLGLLENDVETLRDINDALARIDEGTFGLCEECGEPIARARIKALPYARMCVECKMKEE